MTEYDYAAANKRLLANLFDMVNQRDQLRAELAALKPSWDDAPHEATHLTCDEGTGWLWWKGEPHQVVINDHGEIYGGWQLDDVDGYITGVTGWLARIPNWRNTLKRRPEATP